MANKGMANIAQAIWYEAYFQKVYRKLPSAGHMGSDGMRVMLASIIQFQWSIR